MLLRTMGPKTRAEIQRAYRERKKQRDGVTKKPKKPRNEIQRSYREKKQLENKDAFLEKKNLTSQFLFSWNLSRPSDGKQIEKS